MVTVIVPSLLRTLCGGTTHAEVGGATLGDVLLALEGRCPGIYARLVDGGALRPELAVALNGEVASYALHEPIPPGAEITIVPAIGGG